MEPPLEWPAVSPVEEEDDDDDDEEAKKEVLTYSTSYVEMPLEHESQSIRLPGGTKSCLFVFPVLV